MGQRARDGIRNSPNSDFLGCSWSPTIGFRQLLIYQGNFREPFYIHILFSIQMILRAT